MQILSDKRWLILIVFLGAVLRFVGLGDMPPSLNWDEISHGYNAYSILQTGRDEWGQLFPVANFRAYGDYPLPLNLYLTIPFIFLFGLTESAIRMPHALVGTLTIPVVYLLVLGITKNKKVGLMASFLASVDPWLLFPSRAVFQSNLSVFFLIAGIAFFVNREKNRWLLPISFLFLGLTLFSYHSTRIFTPLLVIAMIFIYRRELWEKVKRYRRVSIVTGLLVVLFFGSLPFVLLNPASRARSSVVFVIDEGAVNRINELRNTSSSPFRRLIYNKVTYFGQKFLGNYFVYFSPEFLFLEGGTQYQFSIPNRGVLYIISLPFFYLGLLFLTRKAFKDKNYRLLLVWLLLSPIPAAITQEQSAVIRATTMLPLPEILVAIGLFEVLRKIPKFEFVVYGVFCVAVFLSLESYLGVYATSYRTNYSWAWQYGYKEAVLYVKENYNKFDEIIVSKVYGEPHEYFLFFLKYDPTRYVADPSLVRFFQSDWYWVDRFDKFWFVNDWQIKANPPYVSSIQETFVTESKQIVNCNGKRCLLITSSDNFPPGWLKVDEIKFLDGKTAFEMYSNYFTK